MHKGQAAIEFLVQYGWAIIVVVVAIGALAYFGVLDPSRFVGDTQVEMDLDHCLEYSNGVDAVYYDGDVLCLPCVEELCTQGCMSGCVIEYG